MDNQPLSPKRRQFLQDLLAGTATATVLMVWRPFSAEGAREKPYEQVEAELAKHDYAYAVNIDNCIGCGNCVRGCRRENSVPADQFRTWVERYIRTDGGVYVDSPHGAENGFEATGPGVRGTANKAWFAPKLCNHCRNAPCVQVCPVGATFSAPSGFVLVDPTHCIACGYCVQGCPYSARYINKDKKVADKCTWCYHRVRNGKLPACVTVCPNKARLFGDLNDPDSEVTKLYKADTWMVLKPAMHTHPYVFYIGLPREVV